MEAHISRRNLGEMDMSVYFFFIFVLSGDFSGGIYIKYGYYFSRIFK